MPALFVLFCHHVYKISAGFIARIFSRYGFTAYLCYSLWFDKDFYIANQPE
jgi:hypothetical protein